MPPFSDTAARRRAASARAMMAFGVVAPTKGRTLHRVVRPGGPTVIFTIGYERRDGEDLISAIRDAGVQHLADIRDKPMSRKPDFRETALRAFCLDAGIEYGAWPDLGSTQAQRDALHATGNLSKFHAAFQAYAEQQLEAPLKRLASVAKKKVVALLCYERAHEECHRSTIAALLADRLKAGVTAIL